MALNGDYTKIPNGFIENMADLTGAEIALFLVICRQTIGWRKDFDRVPYSLIKEMSGYHPQAVKNAALNLIKKKWITRRGDKMTGYFYAPIVKITIHGSDNHYRGEWKSPQNYGENHHKTMVKITTSKERKEKRNLKSGSACPECGSDYWQTNRLIHNAGCKKGGLNYEQEE